MPLSNQFSLSYFYFVYFCGRFTQVLQYIINIQMMLFNLLLTFFILIDYSMQIDTIILELSILYFKRSTIKKNTK